jgi:hypothetical protein
VRPSVRDRRQPEATLETSPHARNLYRGPPIALDSEGVTFQVRKWLQQILSVRT